MYLSISFHDVRNWDFRKSTHNDFLNLFPSLFSLYATASIVRFIYILFGVAICNQFNFCWSYCKPYASAFDAWHCLFGLFTLKWMFFNCHSFSFHYLFCKMISISRPFLIPSPDKLATKGNLCPIKKIQGMNINKNTNTWNLFIANTKHEHILPSLFFGGK